MKPPPADAALPWITPGYRRCFACGEKMAPWWRDAPVAPHGDDPPRQWHPLCYQRWVGFLVGWRTWRLGWPRAKWIPLQ